MKLPDLNVLVNAVNSASREHAVARQWLADAFAAPAGVGLAWMVLIGFVRLTTHRHVLAAPLQPKQALSVVNFRLAEPRARVLHPGPEHARLFGSLLDAAGSGGNLVNDAHLAALAIEHGATLGSFDRDFERFDGLSFERLRV